MNNLTQAYQTILSLIGEDVNREGLVDTPKRAANALEAITEGYRQNLDDIVNGALFSTQCNEMIVVKDIEMYSLCEHHLLPFIGKAHVAYLPNKQVIGLSKIARIVDLFAKRLQIQENLTWQIANTIKEVTNASGVGVVIEAQHMCMMMRGVQKQNAHMKTSAMLGSFRNNTATRAEFLSLVT